MCPVGETRCPCACYRCVELSPRPASTPQTPPHPTPQNIKLLWPFQQMFCFSTTALMSWQAFDSDPWRRLSFSPGKGTAGRAFLLYRPRLNTRIRPSSNTGPASTCLSDAGQCAEWACVHSRKTPRPRLEILAEAEQSCGHLLPHISCVCFGFRQTIHLSMGGSNGWIFRRPESHLHLSLFPYN